MRSVRLGEALEGQLERMAEQTGQSPSEIIRRAVRDHCDSHATRGAKRLADLVGKFSSKGRRATTRFTARDSDKAFTELLVRAAKTKRKARK